MMFENQAFRQLVGRPLFFPLTLSVTFVARRKEQKQNQVLGQTVRQADFFALDFSVHLHQGKGQNTKKNHHKQNQQ